MSDINAALVKQLREKTGAGMLECKNALVNSEGDFAKAEKLLKEKGLAAVEKRSERATNEGKIFIRMKDGNSAVVVELASETDFVARNPDFIELGGQIADRILEKGYKEPNDELNGMVMDLASKIRENMSLKRFQTVKSTDSEYLAKYIHGDGKIGVVVKLGADNPDVFKTEEAKEFAFNLTLHIAAFNPMVIDRSKLDDAFIKEQEGIFQKQMEQDEKFAGKPANVISGILSGKIKKYLADICLLDQAYVRDEKFTVAKIIEALNKQTGAKISINEFVYFKVGG